MGRKTLGRTALGPGADVAPTVRKRFYGQRRPRLGPEASSSLYRDQPLDSSDLEPGRMAAFRQWLCNPDSRAHVELSAGDAASFATCLAALLAYFWLRVPRPTRRNVTGLITAAAAPNWGAVFAELHQSERREANRPTTRRGHGPWRPRDLLGLNLPQRELAALRGWYGTLTAKRTSNAVP